MKVIIVGCGRVGQTLAEKLNSDGNAVTVIDTSAEKVNETMELADVMGVVGNGATHSVLRDAGIESADLFIAVTNSDELNLLCCMIAKKESGCQTIARLKNPEYSDEIEYLRSELGLAMVINPEYAAAEEIARVLRFPTAIKIEPFAKGKVEIIKFKIPEGSLIIGMSIKEMMIKYPSEIIVCTIERGDEAYIANGDFVFMEKDVISIVATPKKANEFFRKIRRKDHSIHDAMIIGGGTITHYLCELLDKSAVTLKIIDREKAVCEDLAAKFPKYSVICANPADKELLTEEGIATAGAFLTLSNSDEENILLSLFAKDVNDGKLVTKIKRTDYDNVIKRLELDTVICPKNVTSDTIVRYVRSTKNTSGSNVETMYNIIEDKVEASEFIIKQSSEITDTPLSQLRFKPNVLVACITRGDKVIMPRGNDVIQTGDAVIVVTKMLGLHDIVDVLR